MPKLKKLGAVAPKKKKVYSIVVSVNDESQKVSGDTIVEALKGFVVPDPIKTEVVFEITKGKEVKSRVWGVHEARRAFNNPSTLAMLSEYIRRNVG